jgi:hypothetical protein
MLRAILHAPAFIQKLYRDGLISHETAAQRAGELLAQMPRAKAGRRAEKNLNHDGSNLRDAIKEIGVGVGTANRWQAEARVPKSEVDRYIDAVLRRSTHPSEPLPR